MKTKLKRIGTPLGFLMLLGVIIFLVLTGINNHRIMMSREYVIQGELIGVMVDGYDMETGERTASTRVFPYYIVDTGDDVQRLWAKGNIIEYLPPLYLGETYYFTIVEEINRGGWRSQTIVQVAVK